MIEFISWESTKPENIPGYLSIALDKHLQVQELLYIFSCFSFLRLWTSWNFCFLAQHLWVILTTKDGLRAELKWCPSRHTFFSRKRRECQTASGRQQCPDPEWCLVQRLELGFAECHFPMPLTPAARPAAAWPAPLLGWSPEPRWNSCF